jgi:tetratricopeptide (TPR) repeat protein
MKPRSLSSALLLSLCTSLLAAQTAAPSSAQGPTSAAPAFPAGASPAPDAAAPALKQGLTALEANQPQTALADFQQALQADPQNAGAAQLAATAALELYQGPLAVQYAEKAHQLDPQSWKIHTTLVAAYAAAGNRRQRDQERALLRQLHSTGAADARQATGFLLEMFPAGPNRVDAVEYFEPMGRFHTYFRFLVRQPDGRRIWEIDVQSNDFDQKSWAQAHPAQAAAGQRQFQLTGHGDSGKESARGQESARSQEVDYRMFSGQPDYDTIRALVIQILAEHPPAA